ncbi:MAG: site-specific integrase [Dehalococcoidia bacterium]
MRASRGSKKRGPPDGGKHPRGADARSAHSAGCAWSCTCASRRCSCPASSSRRGRAGRTRGCGRARARHAAALAAGAGDRRTEDAQVAPAHRAVHGCGGRALPTSPTAGPGPPPAGDAWQDHGLVFANELGRPMEAGNVVRRSFRPLLRAAGLPRIRFHDLRHTAATLLMGQNVPPKVVSEMLGHSQVGITLDLYSHVTPTMQRQATAAMDALLQP